jgi:hypothetical protein
MPARRWIAIAGLAAALGAAAAEPPMKPFVLASRGPGELAGSVSDARTKLAAAGFVVAGAYAPYDGAYVLAVTSPELRAAAAQSRFGGYAAAQRVTVTKVGDEVQVAYTNPLYMGAAYRMTADLAAVASKLEAALGRVEEYGPRDGKTAKQLARYHYMIGMPYFDEPVKLATFASQPDAVAAIEAGLATGRGGVQKVYRVDLPDADESVFGVGLVEGCSGDRFIMKEVDFKPVRSTGHLPYEVLASKGEVYALHAKFRIAVNFPDLSMMGSNSFMGIRCAPDAIEGALRQMLGTSP